MLVLCQTLLDRFLDTAIECGAREKVESALIDGKVPKPLLAAPDDEDMHPVPGGGNFYISHPTPSHSNDSSRLRWRTLE